MINNIIVFETECSILMNIQLLCYIDKHKTILRNRYLLFLWTAVMIYCVYPQRNGKDYVYLAHLL
jgi:hypothetical protein